MGQDTTQQFFGFVIFLSLAIVLLIWLFRKKCETFNPFRDPPNNKLYLRQYEQQDYYKTHPFIYPSRNTYDILLNQYQRIH